jgi:sterol O-acyltransferase
MPEKIGKERRRTTSLNSMIQDMELEVLKQNISNRHKNMVREIDGKLDKIFDDFLDDVTKLSLNNFEVEKLFDDGANGKTKPRNDVKNDKSQKLLPRLKLPEKQFQPRNALLTDLFEIKHIKTIYHIFIVIFNLLLLNVFVSDFADTGSINIGLRPILTGFGGIEYGLMIWAAMQLTIFAIYPVFKVWSIISKKYFSKSGFLTTVWHTFGVSSVICYQIAFVVIFTKAVVYFDMAQASSVAVLMELVRFLMKSHAFIRTNVPRVLNSKNKLKVDDFEWESPSSNNNKSEKIVANGSSRVNDKRQFPSFGQYCYFLFAPTLVYRDEYPRTKQIRWKFVAKNYGEVVAIIFIYSLVSERIMYPVYNQFGTKYYETGVKELMASVFNNMLPGLLCFLCGFYCILHSWMNAAAEMLRFADRKFYSDWWNSTNFSVYYRTWNIIVHDWLYLYVYKDLYEYVTGRNQVLSQLLVFSLSAIFHEYILAFTFKFCYPILFVLFQVS